MELCIKAERIILRYYFCPEVLLIKEYRGYKPEIMSQFVPVTHCAAEDEAITAFVSSVIKNAMEREAAKKFVSEVFFSAFLRTAESDVAVKTGASNSYELNTLQALKITRSQSCPALLLDEVSSMDPSPTTPQSKSKFRTRIWRRLKKMATRLLLACFSSRD